MISTADIRARLADQVPALAGKLYGALEFTPLIEKGQAPPVSPACYVLPGLLQGGQPDAATGIFRQPTNEELMVVLALRSANDPLGDRVSDELEELADGVLRAIAGWAPAGTVGVFRLLKSELVGSVRGLVLHQTDFAITDQLRITS